MEIDYFLPVDFDKVSFYKDWLKLEARQLNCKKLEKIKAVPLGDGQEFVTYKLVN